MADIRRVPFSEIVERVQVDLIRDASASEDKYKGRVNSFYMFDLPGQIDYRHIRKTGSVTTTNDYSTGYITDVSSTTATGDSDCVWTSALTNTLLLKISGYNEVYRVTYSSSTALTLDRTWVETAISSDEVSYVLYQDRYALASDFDRMILDPDKAVYYWQGGNKNYLLYLDPEEFEAKQTFQPNTPSHYTIKWVSGDPYIFVDPPDNTARTLYYTYIPSLKRMSEYTTGTITTLANAGTAVTGSSSDFDGFITDTTNYDYYFRIDGDGTGAASKWYKIASVTDDTHLTLSDAYGGTAISAGTSTYTISMASRLPPGLDLAIIYGTAMESATDQTNKLQLQGWGAMYARIAGQYVSKENKIDYGKQRIHTCYERKGVRR